MSVTSVNTLGVKGRRQLGRPGRFDPSEPLHMTTRHAARNGRVNGSPSFSGSVDESESRRGSFDDARPATSYSLGSQHLVSGRRSPDPISNDVFDSNMSFDILSSEAERNQRSKSKPISPMLHPLSSSRKRKRSSPLPLVTPSGSFESLSKPAIEEILDQFDGDERDFTEDIPASQISDPVESEGSPSSEEQSTREYPGIAQSTEMTPVVSEAVSPASEESNLELATPDKNPEFTMADLELPGETEDVEEGEELADVDDADDVDVDDVDVDVDVDEGDDLDDQPRADGDGRPRRRLAGRRRADHPNAAVEAMMRRQLRLKSAYRAITRALKPVLSEVAQKTIEDLVKSPSLHKTVIEYKGTDDSPGIQYLLDAALERRKAQLNAQVKWNKLQLHKTLEAEQGARGFGCDLQIDELKQLQLDSLERNFLMIARRAQMNASGAGDETEDEDGNIVPKLKGMAYRFKRKGALDPKYDSRSRTDLEYRRAVDDLQVRFEMQKMLEEADLDEKVERPTGFTVMDSAPREVARARRESIANTKTLADAAVEYERVSRIPVIRNEEAIGLQLLSDLASRPSIRAPIHGRHLPPHSRDSSIGQMAAGNMPPPPPLRPPIGYGSAAFDMSPRSQGSSDRFGPPLPHISSGQGYNYDPVRRESYIPSRATFLPPLAIKPVGVENHSLKDSPPLYRHSRSESYDPNFNRRETAGYSNPDRREREERTPDSYWRGPPSGQELPRPYSNDRPIFEPPHPPAGVREKTESRIDPLLLHPLQGNRREEPSTNLSNTKPPQPDFNKHSNAAEVRSHSDKPTVERKPDLTVDTKTSESRKSSMSQSTPDFSPDSGRTNENPRKPRPKGSKNPNTSKAQKDRNGLPKRVWRSYRHDPRKGTPPPENGPAIHRFRLNSIEQTPQAPPSWQHCTPPNGPMPPAYAGGPFYHPPPTDQYGQPYHLFMPPPMSMPPPNYPYGPYPYDYNQPYQPRNSFPPSNGPHMHWPPPPQSPPYTGPPGPPNVQAPPGNHPPDYWQQHRPHSQQGPPMSLDPQLQPPPPPPPGSGYSQHFGGPPIAPANPDHRFVYGTAPPNHPPAFAQQQRQSDEGQRRRAQSDAQNPRFQHWAPRR